MAKIDLAAYLDIPVYYEILSMQGGGPDEFSTAPSKPSWGWTTQKKFQVLGGYGVAYEKEAY